MAEKDIGEKTLESYNDVFADIVNVLLFNGEEVVNENELTEHSPRSAYKADGKIRELERDVAKYVKDQQIRIACIGFENQTDVQADMPMRVIGYDGADYRAQLNGGNSERYPVITLVLYFGNKHWNKARSLSECINVPERFRPYFNDYRINLFEIAYLSEEQVRMFKSDFRVVADYCVKKRKSKDIEFSEKVIDHVQEVLYLMSVLTNDKSYEESIPIYAGQKGVTMGTITNEWINKGIEIGRAKGEAIGEARGEAIGLIKGYIEASLSLGATDESVVNSIMKRFSLTEDTAMDYIRNSRDVKNSGSSKPES